MQEDIQNEQISPGDSFESRWPKLYQATAPLRDIFRNATFLFWQFPILWLPVLIADFLGFMVNHGERAAAHAVTQALGYHSVFGGDSYPVVPGTASFAGVIFLKGSLVWLAHYLTIAFYAGALFATAKLITARAPQLANPMAPAALRSVAVFSIKMLGLVVLAGAIVFALISAYHFHRQNWSDSYNWGYAMGMLMMALAACIAGPIAVKWLRVPDSQRLDATTWRSASFFAIVATLVSSVIGIAVTRIEDTIWVHRDSHFLILVIQAVG